MFLTRERWQQTDNNTTNSRLHNLYRITASSHIDRDTVSQTWRSSTLSCSTLECDWARTSCTSSWWWSSLAPSREMSRWFWHDSTSAVHAWDRFRSSWAPRARQAHCHHWTRQSIGGSRWRKSIRLSQKSPQKILATPFFLAISTVFHTLFFLFTPLHNDDDTAKSFALVFLAESDR